jgi:hypothetical protein
VAYAESCFRGRGSLGYSSGYAKDYGYAKESSQSERFFSEFQRDGYAKEYDIHDYEGKGKRDG